MSSDFTHRALVPMEFRKAHLLVGHIALYHIFLSIIRVRSDPSEIAFRYLFLDIIGVTGLI